MAEFYTPDEFVQEVPREKFHVFTEEFLTSVVKKTIASGDIPDNHSLYFIAATDETGLKAIVGVRKNLLDMSLSINFIAGHEWDGDNKVGAKVIFSHK